MTGTVGFKKSLLFVGALTVLVIFLYWLLWPLDYLLVTTLKDGRRLLDLAMNQGSEFTIGYTHSVDLKPVFEVFSVKPGPDGEPDLFIKETYFRMFGAGMGHWAGHGRLVHEDGWTRIKNIDRHLGQFILRIGSPGVDHTIHYGRRHINLSELAPGQPAMVLAVSNNRLKAFFNLWPDGRY